MNVYCYRLDVLLQYYILATGSLAEFLSVG